MIDSAVPRILWRSAVCAVLSYGVWRIGGLVPMVATAPLWGVLLARPLLDLASETRRRLRHHVWRPLEGRYFAYRGNPVQVIEDADHRRWVRVADVRRIIGFTASDGALSLSYPSGWRLLGRPAEPHFSDDALIAHLAKESSPEALRLRHWVEREVAFPARRVRTRLGIRAPAPDAPVRD